MPTRLGWGFLLLLGGIAFAAINTGNNLLYLLVGICLAAMIISFAAGGRMLARLRGEVTAPDEILARDPTTLIVTLRNVHPRGASPAVEVRVRAEAIRFSPLRFAPLLPGASGTRFVAARFPRRGIVRGVRLTLRTSDPFGLVRRRRRLAAAGEFLIYPAPGRLAEPEERSGHRRGDMPARRVGEGLELHQIRPYRFEDDSRHIDWPATARLGELMVKEFLEEGADRLVIVFDPRVKRLDEPTLSSFEREVSRATALILRCGERRTPLGFIAPGREFPEIDLPGGHRPALEYLATILPVAGVRDAPLAPELRGMPGVVHLGEGS